MYQSGLYLLACVLAAAHIANSMTAGNRQKRMINGEAASINDWPFLASLKYSASSNVYWKICSATLVNRQWLVTVAHCVKDKNELPIKPEHLTVQLRISSGTWQTRQYEVSQIHVHSLADPQDFFLSIENDIALIKLKENAPNHMQSAQLHQPNNVVQNCRSAGWGTTSQLQNGGQDVQTGNYQISKILRAINVSPLVEWNKCDFLPFIGQNVDLTQNHKFFCGGETGANRPNGQYGCIGDSGSPLICDSNSRPVLHGLLVGGNQNCIPGSTHMIFIDVAKQRPWIEGVIQNN